MKNQNRYSQDKRCINCGLALLNAYTNYICLLQPNCQKILKNWTGCDDLSNHHVCRRCGEIVDECSKGDLTSIPERRLGSTQTCVGCGCSTFKKRHSKIKEELLPIVYEHWPWYSIFQNQIACRSCISRLEYKFTRNSKIKGDTALETSNNELGMTEDKSDTTTNKLKRTTINNAIAKKLDNSNCPIWDSESNCIILSDGKRTSIKICTTACGDWVHKRVTKSKRRLLATNYDLFIPPNSKACVDHVAYFDENNPNEVKYKKSDFTIPQFEMFVDEIKKGMAVIDFENVEAMADHICEYWTGVRVKEFVQMYEELKQPKLMKTALAAYLISKITGDNVPKLAKLFNISSDTLKKQLRAVEIHFSENE